MSNKIKIYAFQMSFMWVETFFQLLENEEKVSPLGFLGHSYSYKREFEEALRTKNGPNGLMPACSWPSGQNFWKYYLENKSPEKVSGRDAWRALVPFRKKIKVKVEKPPPWLLDYLVEGYFYPHGIALVVTVRCQLEGYSLKNTVETALEMRRIRFNLQWEGKGLNPLSLDKLAERGITHLREFALGEGASPGWSFEPFTIFTIKKGEGVDLNAPPADKGEIHRVLHAVTKWSMSWEQDAPLDFKESNLLVKTQPPSTAPPSHVLYATKRSRAIWFPALFTKGWRIHSLNCYHRNLLFASLQVESLLGLVLGTEKMLKGGIGFANLCPPHEQCVRNAGSILGRLYGNDPGSDPDTYRSWSLKVQIDQSGHVVDINKIRGHCGMKPLVP